MRGPFSAELLTIGVSVQSYVQSITFVAVSYSMGLSYSW